MEVPTIFFIHINLKHERFNKTNHILTKPKYVKNLMFPSHTHNANSLNYNNARNTFFQKHGYSKMYHFSTCRLVFTFLYSSPALIIFPMAQNNSTNVSLSYHFHSFSCNWKRCDQQINHLHRQIFKPNLKLIASSLHRSFLSPMFLKEKIICYNNL
jgi:hypothetical protein